RWENPLGPDVGRTFIDINARLLLALGTPALFREVFRPPQWPPMTNLARGLRMRSARSCPEGFTGSTPRSHGVPRRLAPAEREAWLVLRRHVQSLLAQARSAISKISRSGRLGPR